MKRIHDSLQRVFERNRLVFWYDATGEWGETFDAFPAEHVVKLKVMGNEFGAKVRVRREPNWTQSFSFTFPAPVRPMRTIGYWI